MSIFGRCICNVSRFWSSHPLQVVTFTFYLKIFRFSYVYQTIFTAKLFLRFLHLLYAKARRLTRSQVALAGAWWSTRILWNFHLPRRSENTACGLFMPAVFNRKETTPAVTCSTTSRAITLVRSFCVVAFAFQVIRFAREKVYSIIGWTLSVATNFYNAFNIFNIRVRWHVSVLALGNICHKQR